MYLCLHLVLIHLPAGEKTAADASSGAPELSITEVCFLLYCIAAAFNQLLHLWLLWCLTLATHVHQSALHVSAGYETA
jgi:hypothetical protein